MKGGVMRNISIESVYMRRRVWREIAKRRVGNEITAKEIGARLGISEVAVRMIVKAIIEEEGQLICSNTSGFFIPTKEEDVLEYAESLRGRIISINKRLNSIKKLLPEKYFREMQIELWK